jgi:hypothetical protein
MHRIPAGVSLSGYAADVCPMTFSRILHPAGLLAAAAIAAVLQAVTPAAPAGTAGDADHDGLDDGFEQALLERFRPQLMVSRSDCDDRPARFAPGLATPTIAAKDGSLYAEALPVMRPGDGRAYVELHYFHLWSRDCGQKGHPLDAEHISALVVADRSSSAIDEWRAGYWYAAAHQDTVCDASHGARARELLAETQGPAVWISRGKHASFLSPELCAWGCGGDRCTDNVPLAPGRVINLGERGAPLNGASWTAAPDWPLGEKLAPDFTDAVIARIERAKAGEIVPINDALSPFKAFVLGTGATASGLARGRDETGNAFGTAFRAIGRAFRAVGRALTGG